MKTLMALDRDPGYAPCGYLICRVWNPEDPEEFWDWSTRDDDNTVLVQTDWDFPGVARSFGWEGIEVDPHNANDATEEISAAIDWLDGNLGTVVEDPGYFDVE